MTLKEIYTEMEKIDNGKEMVEAIQAEISNVRKEAAAQRTKKNDILKQLGIDDSEEADSKLATILANLDILQKAGTPDNISVKLKALSEQVENLTKSAAEEKARAQEEHYKRVAEAMNNEIITAANKHNAVDASMVAKLIKDSVTIRENDTFFMLDQKNGGKEISIADGVKSFLADNPYLVKNYQKSGAGSSGNTGSNGYTKEQIAKMSPAEINANWDAIQKSLSKM